MNFELGKSNEPLACYAENPDQTKGRLHGNEKNERRNCFQRDRDRILHSTAFRRLKDKTQLFIYPDNDHIRNRLTHSLEVAQIARSIARCLKLNEDLTEALALVHDLGHPPFGHHGERVLAELLDDDEGFDHNLQSFRIVTYIEPSYFQYDGLNLSRETVEGIVKHDQSLIIGENNKKENLPSVIKSYPDYNHLRLDVGPNAEAQVAIIADDITYTAHDIDDGLRTELINIGDIKSLQPLKEIVKEVEDEKKQVEELANGRVVLEHTYNNEIVRRIIKKFVDDVIDTSNSKLCELKPSNPDEIRNIRSKNVIALSIAGRESLNSIREFKEESIIRHEKIITAERYGEIIIKELFKIYNDKPTEMRKWYNRFSQKLECDINRVIADYIAGMSDRFAIREYKRLCSPSYLLTKIADEQT